MTKVCPNCCGPWVLYGFGANGFCKNECDLKEQQKYYYLILEKNCGYSPGISMIQGMYLPAVKERTKERAFEYLESDGTWEVWEVLLVEDNSESNKPHIFNLLRKLTSPTN